MQERNLSFALAVPDYRKCLLMCPMPSKNNFSIEQEIIFIFLPKQEIFFHFGNKKFPSAL